MRQRNNIIVFSVAVLTLVVATCFAQDQSKTTREAKAMQVASAWIQSLMRGDTAVTTALSDVPFAMDRKQTIESISELEKILESVVEEKGERNIRPTAIQIAENKNVIQKQVFPADFIAVLLMIDDERVVLCLKPGDTFRVVGLSD